MDGSGWFSINIKLDEPRGACLDSHCNMGPLIGRDYLDRCQRICGDIIDPKAEVIFWIQGEAVSGGALLKNHAPLTSMGINPSFQGKSFREKRKGFPRVFDVSSLKSERI